jgi:hypothetical protein
MTPFFWRLRWRISLRQRLSGYLQRRSFHEAVSILLVRQQGLYFSAQMLVPSTSQLQELGPLLLCKL